MSTKTSTSRWFKTSLEFGDLNLLDDTFTGQSFIIAVEAVRGN